MRAVLIVALASCAPQQVSVGGPQPLQVDRVTLDFGKVRVGTSRDLEVTLTNPSTRGVEIEGAIEADRRNAFSLRTVGFSLAGNATRTLVVRYTAASEPAIDAATLVWSTPSSPDVTVSLEAEAVRAEPQPGVVCGDGSVGAGETCDPPGSCPTTCPPDGDQCTNAVLTGTAATCDVACQQRPITACTSGDGCCPAGCFRPEDSDCSYCGNGRVDFGEICDGSSCPTSCPAPSCMAGTLVGAASTCNARCTFAPVTACVAGDSCCPAGCTGALDSDCGVCGDGQCTGLETCASCVDDCGVPSSMGAVVASCTQGLATSHRPAKTCTPEVVVVGVYQPTPTLGSQHPIRVEVKRTGPLVLALSSYEEARWDVVAAVPGVQIRKIIVSGARAQQLTVSGPNDWAATDIVDRSPIGSWLGCGYEWPSTMMPGSCNSSALVSAAEALAVSKASLFVGCYEGNTFSIE